MQSDTIYEASIPLGDLKAIAGVAKALNDEVTIEFGSEGEHSGIRFWCKDEQKACAATGVLDVEESEGSITLRVPSKNLLDVLAAFTKDSMLLVKVGEVGENLSISLTDGTTGDRREMTVIEAEKNDAPYAGKPGTSASCEVDLKALAKVLAAYKKHADVVDVGIKGGVLQVSYETRRGDDSWRYTPSVVKGQCTGKFKTVLLSAAVTACKAIDAKAKLVMASDGPLRLNAIGERLGCRVYVVASKAI